MGQIFGMMDVLILTEGGKNTGFGHIIRCISIYQAFEECGINPVLIINGDESYYREHVVTYLLENTEEFNLVIERAEKDRYRPELRFCVDEVADLEVVLQDLRAFLPTEGFWNTRSNPFSGYEFSRCGDKQGC
jgi:hypothetical protein